jgi:hypothetical protein
VFRPRHVERFWPVLFNISTRRPRQRWEQRRAESQVFLSYCHKDEKWKQLLVDALQPAIGHVTFDMWTDEKIGTCSSGQNGRFESVS